MPLLLPADDFERAVAVLRNCCAAFDPDAAVDITNASFIVDCCVVDVPANHSVDLAPMRQRDQALFEIFQIVGRILELELGPLDSDQCERPITRRVTLSSPLIADVARVAELPRNANLWVCLRAVSKLSP